jgi:hypothetical protein
MQPRLAAEGDIASLVQRATELAMPRDNDNEKSKLGKRRWLR